MLYAPRVRVYMACSLDGFIAGVDHDLSWLDAAREAPGDLPPDDGALQFADLLREVGCLLMGRSTYDVVTAFGAEAWPYGETPVLVATRRPLEPLTPSASSVQGPIAALVEEAKRAAGGKDVYLDGGDLVRQALDAGLVDELTITIVPVLLGAGIRLFEALTSTTQLQFFGHHPMEKGMLQLRARVISPGR